VEDNTPQLIKKWLEAYASAASEGRIHDTSAGAGPGREYAYLHYVTDDDRHHILVFRGIEHGRGVEVLGESFEGSSDEIQARVARVTRPGDHADAI
jgi:hypothetical protein